MWYVGKKVFDFRALEIATPCLPCSQAILKGIGVDLKREEKVENAFSTRGDDGTRNLIGIVTEVAPDFNKFDPAGYVWGRPGHYPLWVILGHQRWQSADGKEAKRIKDYKKKYFADTGVWPWWIYHESEKTYYHPGDPSTGRGYSGALLHAYIQLTYVQT